MHQKIQTSDDQLHFNIQPIARALGPELARQTLEHYAINRSGARMRRILPSLKTFFSANPDLLMLSSSQLEHALSEHFYNIFFQSPEKSYSTRATEWDSIRLFVNHLIKKRILPDFPILKTRAYTSFFNERDTETQNNHLAPPRELFTKAASTSKADLYREFPDFQELLKALPEHPTDEEYLDLYESDQERLISKVRSTATEIVRKAHADFCYGEELIEDAQIADILQAFRQTGHAIDTGLTIPSDQPVLTAKVQALANQALNIEELTPLNGEILTSYVVHRASIQEIATQKNTSESNVRIHLRRVRKKLNAHSGFSPLLSFLEEKTLATRKGCRNEVSFFSPDHPNGLANIVAATAYFSCGVVSSGRTCTTKTYRPFPGIHHYSQHKGGAKQIAGYLGLTPRVAVALQILIIIETGCNVDSLRRAPLQHAESTPLIRQSESPGFDVLTLKKPRANRYQEFVIPQGSVDAINASFCIRFAIQLTRRLRDATNDPHLWLHSSSLIPSAKGYRISDSAFKNQFKKLFRETPPLTEYSARGPSAKRLRTTVGILRWLQTGGSLSAASSQLNNVARTAASNYIPTEIQTAYYTNQIARFQSLLIKKSISSETKPFSARSWAQDPSDLPLVYETEGNAGSNFRPRGALVIVWESERLATVLAVFEVLLELKANGKLNDDTESRYWGISYRDWKTLALFIRHHGTDTTSRHDKMVYRKANDALPNCRKTIRDAAMDTIFK